MRGMPRGGVRFGLWLGVAAGTAYLVFIGGGWWGIYLPVLRLLTVGIAAAAFAIWALAAWRHPAWRPQTTLWPAIGAVVGSMAISTVFSTDQRISAEYLGYTLLLIGAYLLLVRLFASDFFRPRIVVLATMLFAVASGAFILRIVQHWLTWWSVLGRVSFPPPLRPEFESLTFGNPSAVLTLVALLAVPVAARFATPDRRGIAVLAVVAAVVATVALLSGSRAGWFALGGAAIVVAAAWLVQRAHRVLLREALRRAWGSGPARIGLGMGIVIVGGLAVGLGPAILRRLGEGGEDLRASYVVIALRLFGTAPLFGTGPGTWVIDRIAQTQPAETDYYIPHAHDVPAQAIAELGLLGALAGVVVLLSVLLLLFRAIRNTDPARRRWGWLTAAGLLYFALHNLLDFYANFPAILAAAAIPLAYLDATAPHPDAQHVRSASGRRLLSVAVRLGAVAVGIAAVGLMVQELPAMASEHSVDLANAGRWADATTPAQQAASADSDVMPYLLTDGLAADRAGDTARATADFERVAVRSDLPEAWLNLADEQAIAGRRADAIQSIRRSLRLGIQRPAIAIAAGDLALRLGERDLAIGALTSGLIEAPSFAGDPWWGSNPQSGVRDAVFSAATANASPTTQWQIALERGDLDAAATLSAAATGLDATRITAAFAGDRAAGAQLLDRCLSTPLDLAGLAWCARIEDERGDAARAEDFRVIANTVVGGAGEAGAVVRVADQTAAGRTLAGDPAIFWGTYTYRRNTPWDVLVPSLLHLALE